MDFLLDFLIEDVSGMYLVTNPSVSPENTFYDAQSSRGIFCEGSAMDIQIVNAIFTAFSGSCTILELDENTENLLPLARHAQSRLPEMRISPSGRLQERGSYNIRNVEPGHCHVSQFFGLFPGHQIIASKIPDLAQACAAVLHERKSQDGANRLASGMASQPPRTTIGRRGMREAS